MKLTTKELKEYFEIDRELAKLNKRRADIRDAIIETGESVIELGGFSVNVSDFSRTIPVSVDEIRAKLKSDAKKVLKTIAGKKVQIRKI